MPTALQTGHVPPASAPAPVEIPADVSIRLVLVSITADLLEVHAPRAINVKLDSLATSTVVPSVSHIIFWPMELLVLRTYNVLGLPNASIALVLLP